MEFTYYGAICSDLDLVKSFTDGILKKLHNIIDNEDTIFDIRLIINELMINGVFHGNHCIDSKYVNLIVNILDNKIVIEVKDEGEGIDFDFTAYNPLELKCGGRGLVLVRGLSDELIINDNCIKAIKYFNRGKMQL